MVNQVYTAITKYFGHITNTGYMRQDNVNKLLLLIAVCNLLDNDFRALVSEDDYKLINNALYCLYGSTCLIPFPDYYNNKANRVMYKGSISELAHRVAIVESTLNEYGDKPIVIPSDESILNPIDDSKDNSKDVFKDVEDVDDFIKEVEDVDDSLITQ